MKNKIAVLYATWYGQAEKVARRIGDIAWMHGVETTIMDVRDSSAAQFGLDDYAAVIVVGSVHFGHHPKRLVKFVTRKLAVLSSISSGFVSVSGAAAGLNGDAEAQTYIHKFFAVTGWQPDLTLSAAGAAPYSKYGPFTRMVMMFASRIAGRDSDPSHDYEYTNWFAVEQFVRDFLAKAGMGQQRAEAG